MSYVTNIGKLSYLPKLVKIWLGCLPGLQQDWKDSLPTYQHIAPAIGDVKMEDNENKLGLG